MKIISSSLGSSTFSVLAASIFSIAPLILMSGCGGGQGDDETPSEFSSKSQLSIEEIMTHGSHLSASELLEAEAKSISEDRFEGMNSTGKIPAKSAYLSGAVATKSAAVSIPVFRFYNSRTGAHFFTTSTTERDTVVATMSPPFSLEGPALQVASSSSLGLSPVHRFYNTQTGVHFYTISEAERANVSNSLPQFQYEGIAYYASQIAGQGLVPFFRFYVASRGFHFYTASSTERDSIIANLGTVYKYEGVGYYVLGVDWLPQPEFPTPS